MSLAFFSAVPARDHSCHHTCARARHDNRDDDDDHAKFQDRDHNGPDQLSVLSLPNPFPKLTARARSQVRSRRDTVTDAAAAAQHGGGGGDRRSHGGAVARAMWQRRVTVRLQTITTARNDRAKARYFNSLLLGYAGGGGGERRWQGPRARAALWSAAAAVWRSPRRRAVPAAVAAVAAPPTPATARNCCAPSIRLGRSKKIFDRGLCFSRALAPQAPLGLAHRPKPPGGGLLG